MLHFNKYGKSPYSVVLVHGGPGAAGEMTPVALHLASEMGVIEPLQTRMTIPDLVEELKNIIQNQADQPVVLIGFSWGAWLSIILASQYKSLVRKLVLVGCGPLEYEFAAQVFETRLKRLNNKNRNRLTFLLNGFEQGIIKETDEALKELGQIISNADSFEPIDAPEEKIKLNAEIYRAIWKEAAELRKLGRLLLYARSITCPVVSIHGDYDPHPSSGVIKPLSGILSDFRFHIIPSCGHKPWVEKYAQNDFYSILHDCIIN